MNYLQNYCWCGESHWDGEMYECRHVVSLVSYEDAYRIDWNNLLDFKADRYLDVEATDIIGREIFRYAKNLKPTVLKWLACNVKDRKGNWNNNRGWCVGNISYRKNTTSNFSIFFHRKSDAMAFIRKFSVYKKPLYYCQYFTDIRKELNLETMRYNTI